MPLYSPFGVLGLTIMDEIGQVRVVEQDRDIYLSNQLPGTPIQDDEPSNLPESP
jgi:hypothetical protein